MQNILILSGGGLKGIAHVGVLKALEEKNILKNIKFIAGTSIGGLIGCFHIIGYTPDELKELIANIDLKLILNQNLKLNNLIQKFGIDDGVRFEYVLIELFKSKNINENITMLELYQQTNIELTLTTVCVNDTKLYYINHKTFPNLKVLTALQMTSAIPFFFTPVQYQNKLYIDGGIMNNYPINYYKKYKKHIIGVYLNYAKNEIANIYNIETFLFNTLDCVCEGVCIGLTEKYKKQTIILTLLPISILNFNIDDTIKENLYNQGYNLTIAYLTK